MAGNASEHARAALVTGVLFQILIQIVDFFCKRCCVTTPVDRHSHDAIKPKSFLNAGRLRRFLGRFQMLNISSTGQFRKQNKISAENAP
jgi:hypothetical protein